MCLKCIEKKKLLGRRTRLRNDCLITLKKNTEAATGGVLWKSCSEKLRNIHRTKVASGKLVSVL